MPRTAYGANDFRPDYLASPGWTRTNDVIYSGSLKVDIWKPNQSGRPVLIILHGGGWTGGDKTDAALVGASNRFADRGFCVFNANYTLTGGAPATPIIDIQTLLTWVRANAATYNGAGTKVAVLGASAGGHLALMAAIQGVSGGTRPDAVIGWSPPCDLGALTGSGATFAQSYMGVPYVGNQAAWDAKSPTKQIGATMCPVRIVGSASEDTANGGIAQSEYDGFVTACSAAGFASVTEKVYVGSIHADFASVAFSTGADDVEASCAWLRRNLAWTPPSRARSAASRTASSGRTPA